jgi:hypothetical protein
MEMTTPFKYFFYSSYRVLRNNVAVNVKLLIRKFLRLLSVVMVDGNPPDPER